VIVSLREVEEGEEGLGTVESSEEEVTELISEEEASSVVVTSGGVSSGAATDEQEVSSGTTSGGVQEVSSGVMTAWGEKEEWERVSSFVASEGELMAGEGEGGSSVVSSFVTRGV
jgi:hypothetical protein